MDPSRSPMSPSSEPNLIDVTERNKQRTVHWLMAECHWLRERFLPHVADRLEEAAKEILEQGYPTINSEHDEQFHE